MPNSNPSRFDEPIFVEGIVLFRIFVLELVLYAPGPGIDSLLLISCFPLILHRQNRIRLNSVNNLRISRSPQFCAFRTIRLVSTWAWSRWILIQGPTLLTAEMVFWSVKQLLYYFRISSIILRRYRSFWGVIGAGTRDLVPWFGASWAGANPTVSRIEKKNKRSTLLVSWSFRFVGAMNVVCTRTRRF